MSFKSKIMFWIFPDFFCNISCNITYHSHVKIYDVGMTVTQIFNWGFTTCLFKIQFLIYKILLRK